MKLIKPKLVSAKNFMVSAETENKTRFIQNKKNGRMTGRVVSKNHDGTRNLRFTKDVELDGKPGIGNNDIHRGQIGGRLKKGESKPTSVQVTNHYRNGKYIGHSIRKLH